MLPRTLTRPKESKFNYNKHKTFHGRMEGGGQPASVITHRKCFGVVVPRKEKECAKNDRWPWSNSTPDVSLYDVKLIKDLEDDILSNTVW